MPPLTARWRRQEENSRSPHFSSSAWAFRAWEEGSLLLFISAEDPLDEVGQAPGGGVKLQQERACGGTVRAEKGEWGSSACGFHRGQEGSDDLGDSQGESWRAGWYEL